MKLQFLVYNASIGRSKNKPAIDLLRKKNSLFLVKRMDSMNPFGP